MNETYLDTELRYEHLHVDVGGIIVAASDRHVGDDFSLSSADRWSGGEDEQMPGDDVSVGDNEGEKGLEHRSVAVIQ